MKKRFKFLSVAIVILLFTTFTNINEVEKNYAEDQWPGITSIPRT